MGEAEKKESVKFVRWFSELSNKDISIAGGKGASLSEMYNNKFPIPPGFVITAQAYQYFIEKSELDDKMKEILGGLDLEDTVALQGASKKLRELIENSKLPKELEDDIIEAYDILDVDKKEISKAGGGALEILKTGHEPPFVAVRSSATTEDLADASFAGQQDSFLNVKGKKQLLEKVKMCFSSLFTARAIYYRQKKGFDHSKSYLAVVVQKMIDSEKSGVIFSKNPVKDDENIVMEAVWGLGEGIVSGRIKPDQYVVNSDLDNFKIVETKVNEKKVAIVRNSSGENSIVKLTDERSKQQVLNSYEIKILAQYAKKLEGHYKKPQDIEFAIEGEEIYIVQSRPITTKVVKRNDGEITGEVLVSGLAASPGVASGIVRIVENMDELGKVKTGDVLVTKMTNPDMVVAMQKSAGIITDEGGLTSHASIVSREMGLPCVVGTGDATEKLKEGMMVTVDGNSGKIFEGRAEKKLAEVLPIVPTKTKIKVIVDLPDYATRAAKSESKSVGLVRLEGIIASSGRHPMYYVKNKNINDYISVLVKGLSKIAEPFEEIWIRSSDIRSDEYRNLEGAVKEVEGNPMMGDHGVRFSLKNLDIMRAELTAVKEVADDFPQKKIGLMVPLVISVDELRKTKEVAKGIGMPKNVKIGIMVETPAAVQIINQLCEEGMDFVSFGTNDLTQFTLAIDRNNSDVQDLYNELNPAVLNSIGYVIRRCRKYGIETSICGQAGSKPEMAKFLVEQGIDSISTNADAARKISETVAEIEKQTPVENVRKEVVEKKELIEGSREKFNSGINVPVSRTEGFVVPQMEMVEQEEVREFAEISKQIQKPPMGQMEGSEDGGSSEIGSGIQGGVGERSDVNIVRSTLQNGEDIEEAILKELDALNGNSLNEKQEENHKEEIKRGAVGSGQRERSEMESGKIDSQQGEIKENARYGQENSKGKAEEIYGVKEQVRSYPWGKSEPTSQESDNRPEYQVGESGSNGRREIPPLNDAMSVESGDLDVVEEKKEDVMDFIFKKDKKKEGDEDLGDEWKGERR